MMILSHARSRRQFNNDSQSDAFRANFEKLLEDDVPLVAAADTVNAWLRKMPDEDGLELIPGDMTSSLIAKRVLEKYRFDGEYLVAVDATRLCSFSKRHCDRCLKTEHGDGHIEYFHAVLEAKVVTREGLAFSLGSVFIENPQDGIYDKQDCELNAFYRLSELLKSRFPKLPMCLLMDSLYANEPVLTICEKNKWSYCLSFKKGSIPTLYKDMLNRFQRNQEDRIELFTDDETQTYEWACNLRYKGHDLHAIRCSIQPDNDEEMTRFVFLTDHRPDEDRVRIIANHGGRQRAKIENQGFNVQKNHGYRLVKGYGYQGFAYKNIYYLTQIAHMLHQLIAYGDLNGKLARQQTQRNNPTLTLAIIATLVEAAKRAIDVFGSIRSIAQNIGESFRYCTLDSAAFSLQYAQSIQIRFSFPDSS